MCLICAYVHIYCIQYNAEKFLLMIQFLSIFEADRYVSSTNIDRNCNSGRKVWLSISNNFPFSDKILCTSNIEYLNFTELVLLKVWQTAEPEPPIWK